MPVFILTALAAAALAVPTTLTHQGRLLDADGRPVEGIHAFDFALFEGPVGGAPVWTESADLDLSQGLYTTDLGTVSPLDSRVFDGRTLYLQVTIDGGAPMLPRHVVSSVPYAQRAAAVDFDGIEGLPAGLADGDDDSFAELLCPAGGTPRWDGAAWTCGVLPLVDLVCADGQVLIYDIGEADWRCGDDAVLSEDTVRTIIAGEGYALAVDLAAVATSGAFSDLVGVPADLADGDDDTLGVLVCAEGQVPVFNGVGWRCGDDAVLTEGDVDAMVSDNGYALATDLAPVATSGAYADLTGVPAELADGDDDSFADFDCDFDEIGRWNGAVWACSSDRDSLGALGCADGQVPVYGFEGWTCGDDGDLLADISCLEGQILLYDALVGWVCGDDRALTDEEVRAVVSEEGYVLAVDLSTLAFTGAWSDLVGVPPSLADGDDADTLGRLVCPDGEVAVADGGGWVCGPATDISAEEIGDLTARLEALEVLLLDGDGDGAADLVDNCPDIPNPDQLDSDGDAIGDACDSCPEGPTGIDADGDGVPDACDVCDGGADGVDADGDGVPDACDVCDGADDTLDADGDGFPDACDVCDGGDDADDLDGDGTPDDCELDGSTPERAPYSCMDILAEGLFDGSGYYWINPAGSPIEAWCDMSTDGGGYTLYPVSGGIRSSRYTDDNSCKALGMDIVYPRTRNHWASMVSTFGTSYFEAIPGVYRTTGGGSYTGYAMNSDSVPDWRVPDGGRWWLRASTYSEPNGDYTSGCWLQVRGVSNPDDITFNDQNCDASTANYLCSTNDKP